MSSSRSASTWSKPIRFGSPEKKPEERLVGDLAAQPSIDPRVDRPRVDDALDEPHRRAVREELQLGDAERSTCLELANDGRMRRAASVVENAASARSSRRSQPFARAMAVVASRIRHRQRRSRHAAAPARSAPRSTGQVACGERASPRPPSDVVRLEERPHVVPERARLARRPVVGRCLANEVEPALGPRARRIEEVALGARRGRAVRRARGASAPRSSRRASSSSSVAAADRRGRAPSSRPSMKTIS